MNTLIKVSVGAIFLIIGSLNAQEFTGVATYKSHRKIDLKMDDHDENSALKQSLQEQLTKQFQREYQLVFNKEASLYEQEEQLATPAPAAKGIQITVSSGSDVMYRNAKEARYTKQVEIFGKQFLIQDSLKTIPWQMVNETKNIGNYTCFKATYTQDYSTQMLTEKGTIETVDTVKTTTAWYTPQIPVSHGPEDFNGLPGLILEINDGELTLICSKIVINPEKPITIEEPKRGKKVTQAEFDAILKKKSEEQMEDLKSRSRNGEMKIISFGD